MLRMILETVRKLRYPVLYLKNQVRIGSKSSVSGDVYFEGKNTVGKRCILRNTTVGRGSYMGDQCLFSNTKIGRYCSIAYGVSVMIGKHPTQKFVSTHPSFFSTLKQAGFTYVNEQLFQEVSYIDPQEKVCVKIGADVWIGTKVMINNGVSIGDGAVIGAGSLVLKDVAPYEIVAGVPARKIGERFTPEEQQMLLDLQWWEKDEQWLQENAPLFADIEKMKEWVLKHES